MRKSILLLENPRLPTYRHIKHRMLYVQIIWSQKLYWPERNLGDFFKSDPLGLEQFSAQRITLMEVERITGDPS